jgi:signal transduction histidine kinase
LVLVALAAVMAVVALTRRERFLATVVRRRLAQESALREAAESLAEAFTIEEVTQLIVRTAIHSGVARGAFVEHIVPETGDIPAMAVVEAAAGPGMPSRGTSHGYAASDAERAIDRGEPVLVRTPFLPRNAGAPSVAARGVSAVVVPLTHTTASIGALFLVNPEGSRGGSDALAAAYTFGKLATLAYEKVRLLEDAREGRRQLERAMKGRSRLMRGFSHDVKNPLGAADGFAELLEMGIHGDLTRDQRATILHIRRCIKTALGLINDLHQLGRAETGHVVLERSAVDLGHLMGVIAEDYQGAASAKGLSLSVEIPRDTLILDTDGARVREIVANLMSNAIKYTARGAVTLRLQPEPDPASGLDQVRIDVIDTGPGIAADKQELIFEEFSRLGSEEGGAGVGLAISKLLAEALGGRVSVISRPGAGSTFSLWLPAVRTEDDEQCLAQSTFVGRMPQIA